MLDSKFAGGLMLALVLALPAAAAPGRLSSTGPFGTLDFSVEELAFPGTDPRQVLLRTRFDLFLSRDAGFSWRSVLANYPQIRPGALALGGSDAARWYVTDTAGPDSRVWFSEGGVRWSALPLPALPAGRRELSFFADRFQPANLALEVLLFGATPAQDIYRRFVSTDGGQAWTELSPAGLAVDRHEILVLNAGSLYLSRRRRELASGAETAIGLEAVSRLFFDRTRPGTLYAAIDQGPFGTLYSSTDRGATLVRLRDYGPTIRFLAQSPANSSHLALGDGDGLVLSLDRGNSWTTTPVQPAAMARQGAFDPMSGELLLAGNEQLVRRRLDGSLGPPASLHGLLASTIGLLATAEEPATALAVDLSGRVFLRDGLGIWQRRGQIAADFPAACYGTRRLVQLPSEPDHFLVGCEETGLFFTTDAGRTWSSSPLPTQSNERGSFELFANGAAYYLLAKGAVASTNDDGSSWVGIDFGGFADISGLAIHPDAARGVVALNEIGEVFRKLPNEPSVFLARLTGGGVAPGGGPHTRHYPFITFAHDPAHPDLIYGIHGSYLSRSEDFGESWEVMSNLRFSVPAPLSWDEDAPLTEAIIDPYDGGHLLLLDRGLETRDGGRTFFASEEAFAPAAFGRQQPGHFLQASAGTGVLERSASLPVCRDSADSWCAGGGRYLVTVAWKTAQGQEGRAGRIATGNAGSGLFYFFDPNNWELLVKVLDGCAINQRQWVFAAGTTDVEYELRVEDRWTGQIRHYANQPGQAAAAITDTEAFAGCFALPPPGEPNAPPPAAGQAGEPQLDLLGGRFGVTTRWTDFGGHQGDGLSAPPRSANSGLFYFFDPSNWEVLVKVLDGCAINQHYWVLAAATTDVGFELKVADRQRQTTKTYRNPVGRAAPAIIDLQAFPCAD